MSKKNSHKTMTVTIHDTSVDTSWRDASISIMEYGSTGLKKKSVVLIRYPSDIEHLREQLDKIEKQWRYSLDLIKSKA